MEKSDSLWLRNRATILRKMSDSCEDMHLMIALVKLADEFDQEAAEIEAKAINIQPVKDSRDGVSSPYC